jgi:protein tyrosine phosphatase (PTP) superfamily phosphohydrolase (DUF442 family)
MKKINTVLALTVIFAVEAAAQTSSGVAAQDFSSIQNFLRLDGQFCTGGQPSMEDLQKMKAQGVRSVVNLRLASEYNSEEEAATARKLDLRYFNIPVDKNDLKDEEAEQFLKVTSDSQNRPIFIHCASANRVGAFWMIRRVLVDNWKVEDAETEGRKVGMHDEKLRDWALAYIKRHQSSGEKGRF